MGFFSKAGLDVEIQTMPPGPAIAAAITSNTINIGYSDVYVLATLHSKNSSFVIIAPAAEYSSSTSAHVAALVVPANSPVQHAGDLNGKLIAEPALHSLAESAARGWIDQNGGDSSTVKFAAIPFPAMPAALDAGRIDAAWFVEPFVTTSTKNGRVLAYGFDGIAKRFLVSAWFTTQQWAKDHPDLVVRFSAAMHDTAVWANQNPMRSGEILAKHTDLDPTVIATMTRTRFGEQLTPTLIQPFIDVFAKYNGFSTFPARELIYVPSR